MVVVGKSFGSLELGTRTLVSWYVNRTILTSRKNTHLYSENYNHYYKLEMSMKLRRTQKKQKTKYKALCKRIS